MTDSRRAHDEAPTVPAATVQPTRYEVSCLPEGEDRRHFALTVEYRGADRWAVARHGQCLAADGTWSYEPSPSNREDEWIAAHRFDLDTALRLAREAAPLLTVNGYTVSDALEMAKHRASREAGA